MSKKRLIILIIVGLFLASLGVFYKYRTIDNIETPIINKDEKEESNIEKPSGSITISYEDALKLASEQLDLSKYSISEKHNEKTIEGKLFYLFDIINKEGNSFAEQIAINSESGEILSFNPKSEALESMKNFPIETPIAKEQDWNGTYANGENKIELFQADLNSFEYKISGLDKEILSDLDKEILSNIGKIDGSTAKAEFEKYTIQFTKDDDKLAFKIFSESELKVEGVFIKEQE